MRTIELSKSFKKDYKHAKANPRHAQDVRKLYSEKTFLGRLSFPLEGVVSENGKNRTLSRW